MARMFSPSSESASLIQIKDPEVKKDSASEEGATSNCDETAHGTNGHNVAQQCVAASEKGGGAGGACGDAATAALLTTVGGAGARWRGVLVPSLHKLLALEHPGHPTASVEALSYVEALIMRLLATICASRPRSTVDVEERVARTFPKALDTVATREAHYALERWQLQQQQHSQQQVSQHPQQLPGYGSGASGTTLRRAGGKLVAAAASSNANINVNFGGLLLPVDRLHVHVRELVNHKIDLAVSVFVCGVLENIARDVLKLAGNYVKRIRHSEVTLQDCRVAMCADPVLDDLFVFDNDEWIGDEKKFNAIVVAPELLISSTGEVRKTSYADYVAVLLSEEREFIKTLQLITKVFRPALRQFFQASCSAPSTCSSTSARTSRGVPVSDAGVSVNVSGPDKSIGTVAPYSASNKKPIIESSVDGNHRVVATLNSHCKSSCAVSNGASSDEGNDVKQSGKGQINDSGVDAIEAIFGNIEDVLEFAATLLSYFDDVVEMTDEEATPSLGGCFYEMAESNDFEVFETYAAHVGSLASSNALCRLLEQPNVHANLQRSSHGLWLAARYVLPRLLWTPVLHCVHYIDAIRSMMPLSSSAEDRECLEQTDGLIGHMKERLTEAVTASPLLAPTVGSCSGSAHQPQPPGGIFFRRRTTMRHAASQRLTELSRCVEGWSELQHREISQTCQELVLEGPVQKLAASSNRRPTERYAFLFDGLLVLCKPVGSGSSAGSGGGQSSRSRHASSSCGSSGAAFGAEPYHHYRGDHRDGNCLKLKEKFFVRKIDVADRPDTEDVRFAIELIGRPGGGLTHGSGSGGASGAIAGIVGGAIVGNIAGGSQQSNTLLICRSLEEKHSWLANLVAVNTRAYLERSLDSILSSEQRQHPLRIPDAYRFSEPDLATNIVFEDKASSSSGSSATGVPLIRAATLLKLVERLTFHMYADPSFVRIFLTTYRSFCSPPELLERLIERYDIPDPAGDEPVEPNSCAWIEQQQMIKRFRNEYQQPVQVRVLNVLRHWVEQHYYDFERDGQLLDDLRAFLARMRSSGSSRRPRAGKNMRKWVDSISKTIQRKQALYEQQILMRQVDQAGFSSAAAASTSGASGSEGVNVTSSGTPASVKEPTFTHDPPPIEWLLVSRPGEVERFELLTLHPVEVARQLTLLEFDLYRAVQPSELVNAAWTKRDKQQTSPNLLKIIRHSSNFSFYLERLIVECANFDERVAVVSRCIELMVALQELNNFTGVFAVSSALQSAPVHRLEHTQAAVRGALRRALDDVLDLQSDHWRKYQERLRSINPPCVPFLGMYLTNILHIEEGNPDTITVADGAELINFSKRRKVAEITGEIQQYQNQPYNLTVEKSIRAFLEGLSPCQADQSEKELNDYLYQCSLRIEPRGARQPVKAPRRWPGLSLKSPGLKVTGVRQHQQQASTARSLNNSISVASSNSTGNSTTPSAISSATCGAGSTALLSTTPSSTTASPNAPLSPEEVAVTAVSTNIVPPSTPTSPPSSAGETIHVPVLVPMLDPPPPPGGSQPSPLHLHTQHHATSGSAIISHLPMAQQQSGASMTSLPLTRISQQQTSLFQQNVSSSGNGAQAGGPPPFNHRRQHSHPVPLAGVFFPQSPLSPHASHHSSTAGFCIAGAATAPGSSQYQQQHQQQNRFAFPDSLIASRETPANTPVVAGSATTPAAVIAVPPPPLPPRARRDDSASPALPPRGNGSSPPPLPPRKPNHLIAHPLLPQHQLSHSAMHQQRQPPQGLVNTSSLDCSSTTVCHAATAQHSSAMPRSQQPSQVSPTAGVISLGPAGCHISSVSSGSVPDTQIPSCSVAPINRDSLVSMSAAHRPLLPPKTHKKPRPPPLVLHQSNTQTR